MIMQIEITIIYCFRYNNENNGICFSPSHPYIKCSTIRTLEFLFLKKKINNGNCSL
ncbi:hypothetical protein GLOIN_2v1496891 [Rhizophagus irregularis DAOM 181602=DAOM 197198]|nr:hypothetical protein GLOIN_2v1496891 [Rhizophagus irregularis DAOM 181602=DAOM 197198]